MNIETRPLSGVRPPLPVCQAQPAPRDDRTTDARVLAQILPEQGRQAEGRVRGPSAWARRMMHIPTASPRLPLRPAPTSTSAYAVLEVRWRLRKQTSCC